ncbi:NAD(P)H-hydrate dehydratase [Lacticaseibacillus brantae]|uniref:ADP-dependent (S)-NAD(P)H-hydrate dehydratase n=1 Tax=Lacticaseibacillus brantae DSM 23927 TaxID=1423727 RepID=A0A0R2AZU1_9LACO|nr:NAD(P)H-hydrate dehydratase [Lacticaseibacillus brantae]KRM72309.1 carbohydrate kinase, YjeF related protein [Lacticaseibacillus brantae DSM 23927]
METINLTTVQTVVRPRPQQSHKGTFGRVLVVAGNQQYGGAAILSTSAAVYGGAGLVTVATDPINHPALHARLPEAMVVDYQSDLSALIQQQDVIVIGPGLGTDDLAKSVLQRVFAAVLPTQTVVVDGAAITLIAAKQAQVPKAQLIWTPHQMEWQRLSGIVIADQTPETNAKAAATIPGIVVVKSHRTQIFGQTAVENPGGSAAMATGGSGDTLTGIIAAFVGQFGYHDQVVQAAVYTHSAIADELAQSQYVALPSQVIAALPKFLKTLSQA